MHIAQYLYGSSEPPGSTKVAQPISGMHPVLIGNEELRELGITYSKEHLRRLEADGLFPNRVRLSAARVAWIHAEVIAWIIDRAESRSDTHQVETQNEQS